MKEIYKTPEMDITEFESEDIIRTSDLDGDNPTDVAPLG